MMWLSSSCFFTCEWLCLCAALCVHVTLSCLLHTFAGGGFEPSVSIRSLQRAPGHAHTFLHLQATHTTLSLICHANNSLTKVRTKCGSPELTLQGNKLTGADRRSSSAKWFTDSAPSPVNKKPSYDQHGRGSACSPHVK